MLVRQLIARGQRVNNNPSRLQIHLRRLGILFGSAGLGLLIYTLLFEWDNNDKPLTADIGEALCAFSIILLTIRCCLPTAAARVAENENAQVDLLNIDDDVNAYREGDNAGPIVIDELDINKLTNDYLIDKIDSLSQNQPDWNLLTENEIESFNKIIAACPNAIKKRDMQEKFEHYLENTLCYISQEVLRPPFIPVTIEGTFPNNEGVPVARHWIKTFDAAQLKLFITTCSIQGIIAYAPHSPDDKLNVEDNIKISSGFSDEIMQFIKYARLAIKSFSQLSRKELRLYHAEYYTNNRFFHRAEAKNDLDTALLSSAQISSPSLV
jgi:hypothetical protein